MIVAVSGFERCDASHENNSVDNSSAKRIDTRAFFNACVIETRRCREDGANDREEDKPCERETCAEDELRA